MKALKEVINHNCQLENQLKEKDEIIGDLRDSNAQKDEQILTQEKAIVELSQVIDTMTSGELYKDLGLQQQSE